MAARGDSGNRTFKIDACGFGPSDNDANPHPSILILLISTRSSPLIRGRPSRAFDFQRQ
jgi:hypothetical protein